MRPFHRHRMPVILRPEAQGLWLDPSVEDTDALDDLLKLRLNDELVSYSVSTFVRCGGILGNQQTGSVQGVALQQS